MVDLGLLEREKKRESTIAELGPGWLASQMC